MTVTDTPQLTDYPAAVGVALGVVFTALLLVISRHFDPSGGVFTISLMVLVSFIGIVMFSLLFAIPASETNAAVVGGMTAAFGAVVAFWLGRGKGGS